jgi:hypothetical protein
MILRLQGAADAGCPRKKRFCAEKQVDIHRGFILIPNPPPSHVTTPRGTAALPSTAVAPIEREELRE